MGPPVLTHAGPLLAKYDVLLCDVWGVVHDGTVAYAEAGDALSRFRARGGTVILVSNAPLPAARVAAVIDSKGVRRDAWDAIVSSGDIARDHVVSAGYTHAYCLGPEPRDRDLFDALPGRSHDLAEADVLVCSGLLNDRTETAEDYRLLLARALDRRLELVCANPDLVVDVGSARVPCAGAIAALYETMGGSVFWAGKPDPVAYRMALRKAAELRGAEVMPQRVLAIGDAVRTDLAAAQAAGIDAFFIAGGIHRDETVQRGEIDPNLLERFFAPDTPPAVAAMMQLRW